MRTVTSELAALLTDYQFVVAELYEFYFDGFDWLITSGDSDIVYPDLVHETTYYYSADSAIVERDDINLTVGVEVDECKITLFCNTNQLINGITIPQFALKGGFDNVIVRIKLAIMSRYNDFTNGGVIRLFEGRVSDIDVDMAKVALTISSQKILLDAKLPAKVYQPTCVHTLYDAQCQANRATYTGDYAVVNSAMTGEIWFHDSNMTGFFDLGKITFLTGLNAGLSRTVKFHTVNVVGGVSVAVVIPNNPYPYAIAVGDLFRISAGCDKLRTTCRNKFSNEANFLGWEYMPVPEASV